MYVKFGELPKVEVYYKKNGVFFYSGVGGSGKTYISNSLRKLCSEGSDTLCVITVEALKTMRFGDVEKAKIIILDRADLYINDRAVKELLIKYSKDKVFIVDLKCLKYVEDILNDISWGFAKIELFKGGVKVGM